VSRALRDDPRIAVETRERIREVAESLGYITSRRGVILAAGATGQVAIVVTNLANPFFSEAIEHLNRALYEADLRAVVHTDSPERPVVPERLMDGLVDAAILVNTLMHSSLARDLATRGLPIVQFNRTSLGEASDACVSDQEMGARDMALLLTDLGHTRVGALFGPTDMSTGVAREMGFRSGLSERRVELRSDFVRYGQFSTTAGEAGFSELMSLSEPPTAIFCANDVIAVGAMNAAHKLGISAPDDVTIVGFDDIALAAWHVFRLTTVRQNLAAMSQATVKLLRERMEDPDLPFRRIGVPVELVLRESHGPPAESSTA
jgi:LacI family transcriptional regulator, galactose operon repressor